MLVYLQTFIFFFSFLHPNKISQIDGGCCPLLGSDGLPNWHPGEGLQEAGVPHQQGNCDQQVWEDSNQGYQGNRRAV